MSIYVFTLVVFILGCAYFLFLSVLGIFKDHKAIRRKEPQIRKLLESPRLCATEPCFNPPTVLSNHNWAEFERCVPDLWQVIVLADTVEAPINGLQKAVLENFKRGVKYIFIVSNSKAEDELHGFYGLFEKLAAIAIHKFSADFKVEDLVTILRLPDEWDNVPFVFYRMKGKDSHIRTIAFRGDKVNAGIANKYVAQDQANAEALVKLLLGKPPEKIEATLAILAKDEFVNPSRYLQSPASQEGAVARSWEN